MSQRSDAEISRVLRERDHEVDYGGDATDSEEDEDYIEDQESSDTEVSCDEPDSSHSDNVPDSDDDLDEEEEERGQAPQRRKRRFAHGKDKFKWSLDTPEARGQRSRVHLPAAKGNSSNATNPYESWNALFSDEMLDLILKWTNAEIETYKTTHVFEAADSATFSSLTLNELKAYIGLLYYQGLNNNNRVLLENLWSDEFGTNLYKTVIYCEQRTLSAVVAPQICTGQTEPASSQSTKFLRPAISSRHGCYQSCVQVRPTRLT
ncbi:Uncharacterized protein DBV15_03650 [Temnothorax longispinosus]|uniref:PiggyBac transposable element-derived protein domain-containing protein n=1 Tax=Temnothorax longispinosus TaxID=300112 RepID=A0A4S2KAW2_9HYME|nr:Uncharacterized protein DBV15_03650 [Temnothorax longispinosus]